MTSAITTSGASGVSTKNLLSDDQVADFVINGYHIVEPQFPAEFHSQIYSELEALPTNPGDEINKAVPAIDEVYEHPAVQGALSSLLGGDYTRAAHRHCHRNYPGTRSQAWHQDSLNIPTLDDGHGRVSDHVQSVLVMYYPQDVASNMGPTALIPGSHLFTAAGDRNASHGNFRDQIVAVVPAGSVLILHYDIWHAGTANTSDQIRYMVKYLFERTSESTEPSWNHEPANDVRILERLERDEAALMQRSLVSKRNYRRTTMWNNLAGSAGLNYEYRDKWSGEWPKPNV
ncbi:MAG: phytanoyl-CoA dioxygenase family protein [Chloroflexi bacterium]|nr:phytanoyl-CoA dioxygenase family protein [Chloroflexota bacterium]MDA1282231.1 phytanoyl-CoA dioxygenase family protein [Chloroflexota bacterium]